MMKISASTIRLLQWVAPLVLATLSQLAFAATPALPNDAKDDAAVIATLTAQANAWDQAIVAKDRAAIEASMSEDFRQIDGAGNVETRESFVDGLMTPGLKFNAIVVKDFEVRMYGDVALLSGLTTMSGVSDGKSFESHFRYIDVYVRGSEGWKIVSVQISRIPK